MVCGKNDGEINFKTCRQNIATALFGFKTSTTKYNRQAGVSQQAAAQTLCSPLSPRLPFSAPFGHFKNLYDLMTVGFYICAKTCESNTNALVNVSVLSYI